MNNIQKIECLDTAIHQLLTKSPEFAEEGTTGYDLIEGLYQIKIDILKDEYPVQDGDWPSRRWSNDLSNSIAEIDNQGNLTLETGLTGDDIYFKAISIAVKEGVKTKSSNEITINGYELFVSYNKDTKMYTVKEDTTVLLETTTVAAVRNHCNSWFYKEITGKQLSKI